jgi:uncharacterized SAM-binding protein YcdF (DUF218 family)
MTLHRTERNSRLVRLLSYLITLLSILWLDRSKWRSRLYNFLNSGVPPHQADLIVILEGNIERATYAAELYRAGVAPQILIGAPDLILARYVAVLTQAGVPDSQIIKLGKSTNTYTEAQYYLDTLNRLKITSVVVITSTYHIRRATATYRLVQSDLSPRLDFVGAVGMHNAHNWWKSRIVAQWVLSEYIKTPWYILRYQIDPFVD